MATHVSWRRTVGRRVGLWILMVVAIGPSTLHAQAPPQSLTKIFAAKGDAALATAEPSASLVRLLVGRSAIISVGLPIQRVSLTSPDIADALVTSQSELLINGKAPGTISMFVWDRAGSTRRFEIEVQRDLSRLAGQIRELFPDESIDVRATGKNAVLAGTVSSKDVGEKLVNLAAGFVEKKEEVVSLLQIRDGGPSNQVLLRVRFAEVSRNALTELGASYYSDGFKNRVGSVTTQQFPAPFFDQNSATVGDRQVFGDFLNLFLFDFKNQLGAVIKALQTRGLFQSLAEPNLVAESGKEASFLAGGEFPIPVAQASGSNVAISVQFKEFGVRLNFTPVVNGQRIHLKVRPEVSTLDFNNAVTLQGFRIPALSTRRTETELELQNGQTFAISGLMNNTMASSMRKIPGIGDIPILGRLFQSKAAQKDQTELVVMITPEILPMTSSGVTTALPRLIEPYLAPVPQRKLIEPPAPAFQPSPAGGAQNVPNDGRSETTRLSPAAAAAKMSALNPMTRAVVNADGAPAKSEPASLTPRPLTAAEKTVLERAHKEEQERHRADARATAENQKRLERQAESDRRRQKVEEQRTARIGRERAKRDAEAAKRAAERRKNDLEREKKRRRALSEAETKVRAAEARYQAELARKNRLQQER